MPLTRSFREFVVDRLKQDGELRRGLIEEAMRNVLDGEVEVALVHLRDLVNATMGFDALATETGIPKTSLMRMLGREGNPRAENLGRILSAVARHNGVRLAVKAEYGQAAE